MRLKWFQPVRRSLRKRSTLGVFLLSLGWQTLQQPALAATQVHNQAVTPITITFTGTDPDSPNLSVPVTLSFRTTGGQNNKTWQLAVQATSGANMATCPSTIPINKVQVSCTGATASNGGTAVCAAPFNLSTGLQTLASGNEGTGNAVPYTFNLNFTFTDSWRYIATNTSCSVTLNYQITAN